MDTKETLRDIFKLAWQFVKRNGFTMSEALKTAWRNFKLKAMMKTKICKFYFQKVDMTIREAYGTLATGMIPDTAGTDTRKKNDTVQTFFDSEKQEWRCFKKANLIKIEY